jgi:DNA-binding NtrC family response regulator
MRAKALAEHFAPTNLPVLLLGATGTGKDLLAQWIHHWSGRRGAMVDVNCAALPRELVEAELFGHGPRAFTGARAGKAGLLEAADGSTLFLDEVDSLAWEAQAKLLRVLETGQVRRVGETGTRRVDVRVIAAGQEELPDRVTKGVFRADLYHRLAGVVIELFPMAVRAGDLLPLARHFAECQGRTLSAETEDLLLRYEWPGNVRQVRYAVERAACVAEDGVITARAMARAIDLGAAAVSGGGAGSARPEASTSNAPGYTELLAVCAAAQWQAQRVAERLGVGRSTIYRWLSGYGIDLRARRRLDRFSHLSQGIPETNEKTESAMVGPSR